VNHLPEMSRPSQFRNVDAGLRCVAGNHADALIITDGDADHGGWGRAR
jgi:hypothetical protein